MATIIVEDGTGLANSNSYISEADCTTYATDRGITLAGVVADMLIYAMDYIEQQPYQGIKATAEQALQWPRYGAHIDGYYVSGLTIPLLLKDALCEVVIGIDGGVNPLANEGRETSKEKVGDIEVEYASGGRNYTYLKAVDTKLKKLLKSGGSGVSAVNYRG